jgi:hypothetical protein
LEELKSLEDDRKILYCCPKTRQSLPLRNRKTRQPSTDEDGDVKMGDDEEEDDDGAIWEAACCQDPKNVQAIPEGNNQVHR